MPPDRRRLTIRLAIALLLFAALLAIDLLYGIARTDDAWSLQVFHRLGSGDTPYGDVWYGVTPLSGWIGAGATELLGSELIVLKGLVALCSTAAALLSARIAGQLGVGRPGQVLVGVTGVAYLDFPSVNLYTPLAYLLLLVSMSAVLAWRGSWEQKPPEGNETALLLVAGAAAGLCAATKENIGLLAIAAVILCVAFLSPERRISSRARASEVAAVLGAAVVGAAIPVVPVAVQGALGDLITFGFDKGAYVTAASISYLDGLEFLADLAGEPFTYPRLLALHVAFLIPPLTLLALLAVAWRNRDEYRLTATVALFAAVAVAGVFPRADFTHVNDAIPVCAIAIAWSMKELTPPLSQAVRRAGLAAAAAVVALTASVSLIGYPAKQALGDNTPSDLPHFDGPLVRVGYSDQASSLGAELRDADGGADRTFILMPSAAFYYLLSGLHDPTRFDYPLNTVFGDSGQQEVIAAIRRGDIRTVCLSGWGWYGFRPKKLTRFVRARMDPVPGPTDAGPAFARCSFFRTR